MITLKIVNSKNDPVYIDLDEFFDAEIFIDGIRNKRLTYYASTFIKLLSEIIDHSEEG